MFTDDFDPVKRLAAEICPRCKHLGLVCPTQEDCDNCKPEDEFRAAWHVCPSIGAKCPACGLMGDWPAMCWEPDEKPTRKRRGSPKSTRLAS